MSEDIQILTEDIIDCCKAVEAAIVKLRFQIEKLTGESKPKTCVEAQKQENETGLPCSKNLKELPWRSYNTKQAAKQDEEAWIFADTKGAEALLATLKTKDKAQIEDFEYRRSGKDKKFISRKLLKP